MFFLCQFEGGINHDGIRKIDQHCQEGAGVLGKASNKNLDSKTANVGSNNCTKYARDLYPKLQWQPWCDMFVDWCFVQAFGQVTGRQLIGGGYSAYTPTSAQYYKDKGRWRTISLPGDQVFFKNDTRICHTGIVTRVANGRVYTIEGNTSGAAGVIANGGGVFEKSYALTYSRIAGYGRPDWSLVEESAYELGWHHDANGWWYADSDRSYYKSCWKDINDHRYYFNSDGYAVTGWQELAGNWYYFEPRAGHPLECVLYVTDDDGVQVPGEF